MNNKLWAAVMLLLILPAMAHAQTVYYNTEGGRYYHTDPHCDTIDEKYWDEMAETTTAYTERLGLRGPCSRCCGEKSVEATLALTAKDEGKTAPALRFGGSGVDEISCMAVTSQGSIVMTGYTTSSDGSLSDRTKSGWSGWTAMVDIQGNTLWNFCSRHASHDRMRAPVVHADATITVLLESRGNEYDQTELIRLDMQGGVISRKPLLRIEKGKGSLAPEMPGVFAGGYVIASCDEKKKINYEPVSGSSRGAIYQPAYHWFDFEGNLLGTTQTLWHKALAVVSDRHTIEAIDQTYWLCAMDEKGNRTKLVRLYDGLRGNMEYRALASLEDGGAAAALYEYGGGNMRSTLQRWDAQGNPASEIVLEDFCVNSLQSLGDIMIVCGETGQSDDLLLAVSGTGKILLRENVSGAYTMGRFLIALDEDTVACAQMVSGEKQNGEIYDWDVQLSVVDVEKRE